MSYNEYIWQTGETITAEKLNNLEEGIQEALQGGNSNNEFEVVFSNDVPNVQCNRTIMEILDAVEQDKTLKATWNGIQGLLINIVKPGQGYIQADFVFLKVKDNGHLTAYQFKVMYNGVTITPFKIDNSEQ